MKMNAPILLLLAVTIVMQACNDGVKSPEDEIRAFIEAGVEAAEDRNADDIGDLLHDNYRDHKGHNRKQLASLLAPYFFRHREIHLFTRIDEIEMLADNQAQVKLYVAMAGKVISDIDAMLSLRARIYSFELQLIKQDDWLLQYASWRPATVADLQ